MAEKPKSSKKTQKKIATRTAGKSTKKAAAESAEHDAGGKTARAKKTTKKPVGNVADSLDLTLPEDALYLVDGMGYVFRAFHALPPLSTSKGLPVGAVYGFSTMLLELIKRFNPQHLAVVMDAGRVTFRNEIYPEYKAQRTEPPEDLVPQFELIDRAVQAFNIPLLREANLEADDVMASLAEKMKTKGRPTVLVSSDKDLMQLVDDSVMMYDPMKRKLIGREEVIKRFGVPPEQVVEIQALTGDASDNIPGVKGVGPKTAAKLIQEYGDAENVVAHVDDLKGKLKERIAESVDDIRVSRELATLVRDARLVGDDGDYERKPFDPSALIEFFREMEFTKLISQLSDVTDYQGLDRSKYEMVTKELELDQWINKAKKRGIYAFDLESTSLNPMEAELCGVSLCIGEGEACYVPVGHNYLGAPKQLERDLVLQKFRKLWDNEELTWIAHNAKYDKRVLRRYGIRVKGKPFDTMIASYLIDPGRSHGLDNLALDLLEHRMISYAEVAGKGQNQRNFSEVEVERATEYAAEDAEATWRLYEIFKPRLEKDELQDLFENLEMPLLDVLIEMEETGVRLDLELLGKMSEEFGKEMQNLLKQTYEAAGHEFNIGSTKDLQDVLFNRLGLKPVKRTKTGFSTDQEVLEKLAAEHRLPALIIQYRGLSKLKSTYIDALPLLVNKRTGRVHTSFNQTVATTGRLSSSDPNLQNIPIKTTEGKRIREAFIPEEGWVLASADYSQVELRILAAVAGDAELMQAFRKDADIHAETAAALFDVDPKKVESDQRRVAKTVNFSVVYGVSSYGLAQNLGIEPGEAQHYIDAFYERYSGVRDYFDRILEEARQRGYVTTLLGRRRYLPDINAHNYQIRMATERTAINTPIQGSAADLIKRAMIAIDRELREKQMKTRMLIQVHDELVFEVPPDEREVAQALILKEMAGGLDLAVPLKVDFAYGPNWAAIH